jgi:DNA-binding beta-propeller fold protein YncE
MKKTSVLTLLLAAVMLSVSAQKPSDAPRTGALASGHYLYVAVPGIRDYLGYGGHGILVFDIDNNHRFVKRIKTQGLHPGSSKPSNVKGVAVSIPLNSIYITTLESIQRIDLATEKVVWEKFIEGGADRLSVSPDGKTIYLPSLEKEFWSVLDAQTGDIIKKIITNSGSHNTIYGPTGNYVYLAGLKSPMLNIAETKTHTVSRQVGPFGAEIRPFTINGSETLVFVNVNELLGFEVGDLTTGKKIARIEVEGWDKGPVRRHGNPAHGIGLTPDEKELWLCDGFNMRMHVFSAVAPFQQLTTIPLQDMPGWITFSLDGKYAYPSSGEVIDVKTRKILLTLQDEFNNSVSSEKIIEIQFANGKAVKTGDQFGLGRVTR